MGGRGGSGGAGGNASRAKMPELSGSEKQVSWANDIRATALSAADANVRNAQKNESLGGAVDYLNPSSKSAKEVRSEVVKAFQGQTSAKAIIENRANFSQSSFLKMAAELDYQKGRRTR